MELESLELLAIAAMIVVGIILCLAGYKIFKLYSAAIGFLIGLILGYYLSSYTGYLIYVEIILGIILGAIFWRFYEAGLFLMGAIAGYMLGMAFIPERALYSYLLAALFGVLTIFLEKLLLVLITAIIGSSAITVSVYFLVNNVSFSTFLEDPSIATKVIFSFSTYFLLWLVMTVVGAVFQVAIMREKS